MDTIKEDPAPDLTTPSEATPAYWIRGIPAPLIETFWHLAAPFVKRALDYANGEFEHTDFRERCKDRDMQLWIVARPDRVVGAITTEIAVYPRKKHLRVVTLAGNDFDSWKWLADDVLQDYARTQGCTSIECFVRRGFAKRLTEQGGYKMRHCVLTKDVGA